MVTHGALRYLLGSYLDSHPASIRFIHGSRGKPALASAAALQFNITHSGALAAVALTTECPIGIDVELIRPVSDMERIAGCFFCMEEAEEIMSLPPKERDRAFFRCWTRKEAYVKAIGYGLSTPLDCFRVTLEENTPARSVHIGHDPAPAEEWTLHDLRLDSDYAGAIAHIPVERAPCRYSR